MADVAVLVRVMEKRKVDLEADGTEVRGPPGIIDGGQGVLGLKGAEDGGVAAGGVDDGAEQLRPLVVADVRALSHGRRDLERGGLGAKPLLDPPLRHVGHLGQVQAIVVVERSGRRRRRALNVVL